VTTATVFLLSPANCAGKRARMLLTRTATIPLAARLRDGGIPLGEAFSFMSGLYFRGKLTYATVFGTPVPGWSGVLVIAPGRGLLPADRPIGQADLEAMAAVPVDPANPGFAGPLVRDARLLARALGVDGRAVLLGSIATAKYVEPLDQVLGERLLFPATFVGRGDMSRGGLLLRHASAREPLAYVPVRGAVRHGVRPPKLGRLGG
jgi:hypothetical protein